MYKLFNNIINEDLFEAGVFKAPSKDDPRIAAKAKKKEDELKDDKHAINRAKNNGYKFKCNISFEVEESDWDFPLTITGDMLFKDFIALVGLYQPEMDAPQINGLYLNDFVKGELEKKGVDVGEVTWEMDDVEVFSHTYTMDVELFSDDLPGKIVVKDVTVVYAPKWPDWVGIDG